MTSPVGAPEPTPRPRAPSFTTRPEPGIALTPPSAGIESQVRRELFHRLLRESPRAEIAHLVVYFVVAVLLAPSLPPPALAMWGVAIAGCVVAREILRRRLGTTTSVESGIQRFRLALAATGLVWGVGAAAFMPSIPIVQAALLLVVLSGLAAGGVASVSADLWSYRYFLAGLLVPAPVGIVQANFGRDMPVVIVLLVLYAAAMMVFHRSSHELLFGHLMQSEELSQRENKAVQDRAYLDALLTAAPVAIAVVDHDGRIRGINPQFTKLFGYQGDEVMGRDLNDLVVPRSELAKASRLDQRARKGELVAVEAERRRKDGTLVAVRASAGQVESSGGGGDVLVIYENISDRRRAEDALTQLASIVQSSEDAIIGQTLDGTIATWNAAAHRLFGYAPGEVLGRPIAQLAPPERAPEMTAVLDRIRRGEHVDHFETVRLRKDGTPVPVSLSVSLTRDAAGRIRGFSTIARDVREQVATRDALRDARDVAQRLAQTRSAFLANMSHEIRTPMNAILGLTELLLDTDLAPEQRHSLTLVQTSGETLLTLLNDILDFSKIEAEHLELEHIAFDLPHLLDSTMSLLAIRARERRLELVAHTAPDVPAMVRGDPTRLRQILTNLISNAIKFTHQGEVVVSAVRVGDVDGRAAIRMAVRDTGIGIAREKLGTIFEEFSQADASMTRKYGGTGLGLAIARRLVRLMGGELAVASEVGKGTEFSFTVGFEIDAAPAAATAAEAARLEGRRALVIDDNATNRRIVLDILTAAGMHVSEAADGATGLASLRSSHGTAQSFDLAIIDAQMPELDGFELATAVRADPDIADIPLVMLTSAGQRGDGQRCRELGIRGYLPKPMSRSDLLEAVGTVLATPDPTALEAFVTRHSIAESRRRLHVLVAEDNPVNQEVAASMLRKRGHEIDVVNNGREAVEASGRKRYDAILMDVQMPEMDGFEATHAIRATEHGRTLPIIALTAHALSGERERCLAEGMSGYLTKPFKAHELFAVVEGWAASASAAAAPALPSASGAPAPAPVDLDAFRHEMRAAGAEEAVDPVLDTFLQSAPDRVAALTRALATGTATEIERAAHAFKSASATIGAKGLATLLQQLEVAGKAGDVTGARRVGEGLARESEAVITYLRQVRAAPSPGS